MNPEEAQTALDDVARVKSRLTTRARWPFWRHLLFGLLAGLLVAGSGLTGWAVLAIYAAVAMLTGVIVWLDRRYFGMFVSGYRGSRTKWALAASFAVMGAGALAMYLLVPDPLGIRSIAIVACVIAAATATSIWWESLYRSDLAAEEPS